MKKTILFTLLFAAATFVKAQTTSSSVTQTITLNLQNQIDISIVSAAGTSFTFASTANYAAGLTNSNASQFQVRSNRPWAVTVNSSTASFSGPAGNNMPASVLGVRLNGGTSFTQLATSTAGLTTGSRGTNTFNVDYNANPGFNYDAGTYTLSVVYTATQQ